MNEIKIKNVDETIYNFKAKSGLDVYIWNYELSEEITSTLTVKCGGIHTDFMVGDKEFHVPTGIAHLVEHLKFNIKKDLSAHDIFHKLGSYTNAYTTYDHTSYIAEFTDNVSDNINTLLSFVINPYFTNELLKKEKPIVSEEANGVFDDPYNLGYFKIQSNTYKNSKYKNLVVGTIDDIKSITLEDINNLYNSYYHPENMILVVTGNVNPYEVEKIVNNFFEDKTYPKFIKPEMIIKPESKKVLKEDDLLDSNVSSEKLFMTFKYNKDSFTKKYDLYDIYNYIMISLWNNFGYSSKLRYELIEKGLIDTFYYSLEKSENNYVIYFEISTLYPDEVKNIVLSKMKKLEIDEISLARRKKVLIANSILGYDNPNGINNMIRQSIIEFNKIIDNEAESYKKITLLDIENINKLLKDYSNSNLILKPIKRA